MKNETNDDGGNFPSIWILLGLIALIFLSVLIGGKI